MNPRPTPSSVSRYLAAAFPRSMRCGPTTTPGYQVRRGLTLLRSEESSVIVDYEPGTRVLRSGTPEGIARLSRSEMEAYRAYLEKQYLVLTNADESGEWDALIVRQKPEGETK